jgi:alkanesulfonate monooxygenase SsuD/methylene tetrahydromethanopterin reductase-like flavin-dependent oxidoreductase (luciferase family)
MAERLALGVIPGAGWRASEIRSVAKDAENAGFEAIFATEVNNDVLATAQLMGSATTSILVGSWVANIYLRNSYVCAKGAALISDATDGRMILGLGVSHQPVNAALAVDMKSPLGALRTYTGEVAQWLHGDGPPTHLSQQASTHHVPIYLGGLTSATVELAGEMADGIMPYLWSPERLARSRSWIERGKARSQRTHVVEMTLGLPTFVGDDIGEMTEAARANLNLYMGLPFFQHLLRVSGYEDEAAYAERGESGKALSDRFIGDVCLIGPISRCRDRLAAYAAAGLDLPILMPAVGVKSAQALIEAFAQ